MMTFVSDGLESTDRILASFPFDKGVMTDEVALAFAVAQETLASRIGNKQECNLDATTAMTSPFRAPALLH
jgi:hypothetical protein